MIDPHLITAIQTYHAAVAAIPDSAPDDVMDAAIDREASALEDILHALCHSEADVIAKLAIAGGLLADEEETGHRAAKLIEAIARDVYALTLPRA